MKIYNCILVYAQKERELLFCLRGKAPYEGLLNLVGGKLEDGEEGIDGAYRELYEETGISREQIELAHFIDMKYYREDILLEFYIGLLPEKTVLREEKQKLFWVSEREDFFDSSRFAGNGNVGHVWKLSGLGRDGF